MWRFVAKKQGRGVQTLSLQLRSPVVAIQIRCPEEEPQWIKAGWLRPVSVAVGLGNLYGPSKLVLLKGFQQIFFEVPGYPYNLNFWPRPWLDPWEITVWERELEDEQEPTPSIDLIYRKLLDMESKIDAL